MSDDLYTHIRKNWNPWFAWHPVPTDEGFKWLCWVNRRWESGAEAGLPIEFSGWDYRILGNNSDTVADLRKEIAALRNHIFNGVDIFKSVFSDNDNSVHGRWAREWCATQIPRAGERKSK